MWARYLLSEDSLTLVVEHEGMKEPVRFEDLWFSQKFNLITEEEIEAIDRAFDDLLTAILRKFSKYYKARAYVASIEFTNKKGKFAIDLNAKSIYFTGLPEKAKKEMTDLILNCVNNELLIKGD